MKPKHILAPSDFSHHSESAIKSAFELAEQFGATLHLVHVLAEPVSAIAPEPMIVASQPPEYYQESEKACLEALQKVSDTHNSGKVTIQKAALWGSPVESVLEYAARNPIDLIVISTHGRTGLSHVIMGSVAESIIRNAPCPVLTFRDKSKD
jgi:nucleotide-binding universal stress UspA family protein